MYECLTVPCYSYANDLLLFAYISYGKNVFKCEKCYHLFQRNAYETSFFFFFFKQPSSSLNRDCVHHNRAGDLSYHCSTQLLRAVNNVYVKFAKSVC
jgi:hypothetical protein